MDRPELQAVLFGLQSFQVFILIFHDFLPLRRLNGINEVQSAHPRSKLIAGMLISSALPAFGWVACTNFLHAAYPHWLLYYLLGSYGFLFVGEIEAWWATYVFGYRAAARAPEYKAMYGRTYAFLPARHGIVPNALHVLLHTATFATLGLTAVLAFTAP